ncbi:MAG: DMT family transporter [Gracilibacteraceae bacterium]|jgi:transporter family-2 protein|nr:DMT family transporter [Gracilibacteraceae bacterium]
MDKLPYLLLMVFAGWCGGVQASVNSGLGKRVGTVEGSLISFTVGALALTIVFFFFGKGDISAALTAPKWQLTGGLLGAAVVVSMIVSVPHIGVASVMLGVIVGQLTSSLFIDNFGLMGAPVVPFDLYRLIGVVFMLIGVLCVFRQQLFH